MQTFEFWSVAFVKLQFWQFSGQSIHWLICDSVSSHIVFPYKHDVHFPFDLSQWMQFSSPHAKLNEFKYISYFGIIKRKDCKISINCKLACIVHTNPMPCHSCTYCNYIYLCNSSIPPSNAHKLNHLYRHLAVHMK